MFVGLAQVGKQLVELGPVTVVGGGGGWSRWCRMVMVVMVVVVVAVPQTHTHTSRARARARACVFPHRVLVTGT